jgi:hypothetical protein
MGDVQHELDHSGKMLARLAEEFRKPRISAILTGEAAQYQAIEDAFWQLLVERGVDTAVGNALDVLGRIVGEPRQGALDADYRLRVRARIRVNRSDGTIEDVIDVVRLLIGSVLLPSAVLKLTEYYPAAFVIRVSGITITPAQALIYRAFINQARGAGIGSGFGWQQTADADAFVTATSSPLTVGAPAGATSFTVADTSDFPATGTIVIDDTLAGTETLNYTTKTPTTLSGFPATANLHAIGAMVTYPASVGKGWGDDANAATGGALVGVT